MMVMIGNVPGLRFRSTSSYLQMQMELDETAPISQSLLQFADRNRVLLNIVLRHNVHLLESSFAALITAPRCRHLLHFDIKRAFFKMRLRRMRSSVKLHSSLRIAVRRNSVFEDSFQSLRHRTPDELRKRLSVTFHGEEGVDAGNKYILACKTWFIVKLRISV